MGLPPHNTLTTNYSLIFLSRIGPLVSLQDNHRFWKLYCEGVLELRSRSGGPYRATQMMQGLRWLARTSERLTLPEIQIAEMQPTWLESIPHQRLYRFWISICGGSIFGLIVGLTGGLSFALVGQIPRSIIHFSLSGTFGGFCSGIAIGLASQSLDDLNFGPLGTFKTIRPLPTFRLSWRHLYGGVQRKLLRRLIVSFLMGGLLGLGRQPLTLIFFAIFSAVIMGLLESLFSIRMPHASLRHHRSMQTMPVVIVYLLAALCGTGLSGLILLAFTQVIPWPSILAMGPPISLYFWFFSGGIIHLQRLILRSLLWQSRVMPWNMSCFLNEASTLGLLQRNGTRYRFTCSSLQAWFAQSHNGLGS